MPKRQRTVCGKRLSRPLCAPANAHCTHRLEAFVNDLRGLMTVWDLTALTGFSWDTLMDIINTALEQSYGHPRLKDLRYLLINEIYLGRQKSFTLWSLTGESGRIVYVARGKGIQTL